MLVQKIAENINIHFMKQHDGVVSHAIDTVSRTEAQTVASVALVTATTSVELAATSSVVTAVCDVVSIGNKSMTSTADLSINEDSLMAVLQVVLTTVILVIVFHCTVFTSL